MSDYTELVKLIKQTAVEAIHASKPVTVVCGKVVSASPLQIKLDQKLTLGTPQLLLCRGVTNFSLGQTVYNFALNVGDDVVMLRLQGGQKYLVIDRLGGG